jgi:serine/threonine protein phosphatase PrpC
MIMVVGQRGRLKLQTISHSPVGYALEAGVLDEAEAMQHEDRHLVSNFVGTSEMRIELGPLLRLAQRDTLLIATDGLFDNLEISETVERMRTGSIADVLSKLTALATERMRETRSGGPSKPDDLTLLAYRLSR